MSLQTTLKNPLDRLSILPTTMNWRGVWVETEQYYRYDLVTSPINLSTYILSTRTALKGGDDPTLNADWIEFSETATGVQSVTAGTGIENIGTTTDVILQNTGVRTIEVGSGLELSGDANNPILTNTGIVNIVAGAGINIETIFSDTNPPVTKISNTGVLTVTSGNSGIDVNNTDPTNPTISNTGVNSVSSGNAGINIINADGVATVTNTGILTFAVVGTGLSNNSPSPNQVELKNTGVLSVAAASLTSGIFVDNTDPQNPKLASYSPQLTQVTNGLSTTITPTLILAGSNCSISFTQTTGNLWATYLANGDPFGRDGWFVIDLTRIILSPINYTTPITPNSSLTINLVDPTHTFQLAIIQSNDIGTSGGFYTPYSLGNVAFRLQAARASGLTNVTSIVIGNFTSTNLNCVNTSAIYATYYPDGQT